MASDRFFIIYDVTNPCLVAADLTAALNQLPDDVRITLTPTVGLVLSQRAVVIDGNVAQASPLLLAFAAFVDRLVDEIEAAKD